MTDWDISIFKNFTLTPEGRLRLQYRLEMYNAFNPTQFNGVDTTARFDLVTGSQVNGALGNTFRQPSPVAS